MKRIKVKIEVEISVNALRALVRGDDPARAKELLASLDDDHVFDTFKQAAEKEEAKVKKTRNRVVERAIAKLQAQGYEVVRRRHGGFRAEWPEGRKDAWETEEEEEVA
jgi:ASC-1-like (ASCH) protein